MQSFVSIEDEMSEKYALKRTSLWLAIGWLLIVTVVVLSLIKLGVETPGGQSDKIGHFLAYSTLMFWFAQIYSVARTRLVIAIGLALLGVGLEIAQSFTGYRTFEYADMA